VDAAVVLAIGVVVLVVALVGLIVRRRVLGRGGGTVDCALRLRSGKASWRLGVGRYGGDELRWFRIFGVRLSADAVLARRGLRIVARRSPDADERGMLGPDAVIVTCAAGESERTELAMSRLALTGFLAWLEGAPPGAHVSYAD